MEINHVIREQLYTNSLLICPISEEKDLVQYVWVRKDSPLAPGERPLTLSNPDLYYQCSLYDYQSTIQLLVQTNSSRVTYTYGPIKLQEDLHACGQYESWKVRVQLGKKDAIDSVLTVQGKDSQGVKVQVQMKNEMKFEIMCPAWEQEPDYESVLRVADNCPYQLEHNFSMNRISLIHILKKLKIYSYEGNYIKYIFNNQKQRDAFLYHTLFAAGCPLPPLKSKPAPKHKKAMSEYTVGQFVPCTFIPPKIFQNNAGLNDICEMLETPHRQTLRQEMENLDDGKTEQIYSPSCYNAPEIANNQTNTPKKKYKLPDILKQKPVDQRHKKQKFVDNYQPNEDIFLQKKQKTENSQQVKQQMQETMKKRIIEGREVEDKLLPMPHFIKSLKFKEKKEEEITASQQAPSQPKPRKFYQKSYRKPSQLPYQPKGKPLFPVSHHFAPQTLTNVKSMSHLPKYQDRSDTIREKSHKREYSRSISKKQPNKPVSNWSKK